MILARWRMNRFVTLNQDWVIWEIWIGEESKSRETWRDSLGSADCRA